MAQPLQYFEAVDARKHDVQDHQCKGLSSHYAETKLSRLGGMPAVNAKKVKTSEKAEELLRFELENEKATIRKYRRRLRQSDALAGQPQVSITSLPGLYYPGEPGISCRN
ncbi:MAG: hypothetical protein WA510_30445 [Acidobacteriaceae bacterium]